MEFPSVWWDAWKVQADFWACAELPGFVEPGLWAVLTVVFHGDDVILADIAGRGLCSPSGRIEPGESIWQAAQREAFEEAGVILESDRMRLIGCYRLTAPEPDARPRFCPVFVADALGFEPIPAGSESLGRRLVSFSELPDFYYSWDDLMAAVFDYAAETRRGAFFQTKACASVSTGPCE
ncbi:MAG: NUDIX domain-containing protein [Capsulimonadaceae bacterium]